MHKPEDGPGIDSLHRFHRLRVPDGPCPHLDRFRDSRVRLLFTYIISLSFHTIFFPFSAFWIAGMISFVSGIVWAIIIPGMALLRLILPDEKPSVGMLILVGLVLEISIIHFSFLLNLWIGFFVHPLVLMAAVNSVLILGAICLSEDWNLSNFSGLQSLLVEKKTIAFLLLLGLAARLLILILGTQSIGPDASLYSNYAMNLLDGSFSTNVLRDSRIYDLGSGIQYSFHQGFVYLASLSFMLVQPTVSGPVPILLVAGVALVAIIYQLGNNLFSSRAGLVAAGIIATHPTFVFHSAVAYGPEITSLLAILGCLVILTRVESLQTRHYLMAGVFLAIGDLIWYPNFLLFVTALPFFLYLVKKMRKKQLLLLVLLLWSLLSTRIFFVYLDLYLISVLVTLGVGTLMWFRQSKIGGYGIFAFAVLSTEALWRGAVQLYSSAAEYFFEFGAVSALAQAPNPALSIFFRDITLSLIIRFVVFLTIQATPILLVLAIAGIYFVRNRRSVAGCLIALFIGCLGTLFLFASLSSSKSTLTPEYVLSDSRFFLSLATLTILPASGLLGHYTISKDRPERQTRSRIPNLPISKAQGVVLLILMTSYIPLYVSVPSGLGLINHEDRFGWAGLPQIVLDKTTSNDIILTQQATEMAWLTGRKSVYTWFSNGASLTSSLSTLRTLLQTRNASYFVMDGYTAAKYQTLDEILKIPMERGDSIPIDFRGFPSIENNTILPSIVLEAQTEPNINGDYARLYSRADCVYSHLSDVSLLASGWAASNGGNIENASGMASLVIGEDANYTNTWRPDGYDLSLTGSSGFILIDVSSNGASLARIEFYDETGTYYGKASSLGQGTYFFYIGSSTIGDIRFVIEGEPGESVLVESIEVWGR